MSQCSSVLFSIDVYFAEMYLPLQFSNDVPELYHTVQYRTALHTTVQIYTIEYGTVTLQGMVLHKNVLPSAAQYY